MKYRIAAIVASACLLTGCYDLSYLDKHGVLHREMAYQTKEQCWQAATIMERFGGSAAWCTPDWMETEPTQKHEASK